MKILELVYKSNPDGSATIYYRHEHSLKLFAHCVTIEVAEDIISYYENYTPKLLDSKEYEI